MSTSKRPCSVCRTASCHHPCTLVQRLKSVGIIFGFFVFCFKPSHFVCLHCLASMLTKTLSQKLFKEVGRRSRIFRPSRAVVSVPHSLLAVIISWIFWCLFFFSCGQLLVSVLFSLSFAAISSFITYVFLASHATFLDTNEIVQ